MARNGALRAAAVTTALLCSLGAAPQLSQAQCSEPPTVWMDEKTAESHLLAKRDLQIPADAPRLARIQKVILQVTVDREGTICDVEPASGRQDLRETAVKIVKEHWRYRRFLVDWKPVVAQFPVTVHFLLPRTEPRLVVRRQTPAQARTQGSHA